MQFGKIDPLVLTTPFSTSMRNTLVCRKRWLPFVEATDLCSGQSPSDKITKLREVLDKNKYKAFVVTMLDEVAWLFNLRGSDIDYNPGA